MERPLYIVGGTRRYRRPGGPEKWGMPMPLLHESIATIPEKELVARVLCSPHYRHTLLSIKGMFSRGVRLLEQVKLRPHLRHQDGEIDILVVPGDNPEQTTAIEVKRFKAIVDRDEQGFDHARVGHPKRLHELMSKGVDQANELRRIGFAQVYLWIFVAVDTRARNNGWYTYDGPDSHLRSQIDQAISPDGLHPTIGLMQFEWVQPMDRPPFELCSHGGQIRKLATAVEQPFDLTGRLRALPSPPALAASVPERLKP